MLRVCKENEARGEDKVNIEQKWDRRLKIDTVGRDDLFEDAYHYPYEPTPYEVLERLVESGYINRSSLLLDYGCGKGRVSFFLNAMLGCKTLGVEFDKRIFQQAEKNKEKSGKGEDVTFYCENAEQFEIRDADCFYFFNPFSVKILQSVIGKIKKSYYNNPREMRLFFYYPSDEYIYYLMTIEELFFCGEINCKELFLNKNERERILIFKMVYCGDLNL